MWLPAEVLNIVKDHPYLNRLPFSGKKKDRRNYDSDPLIVEVITVYETARPAGRYAVSLVPGKQQVCLDDIDVKTPPLLFTLEEMYRAEFTGTDHQGVAARFEIYYIGSLSSLRKNRRPWLKKFNKLYRKARK